MKNKFILGALSILTVLNCIIPVYANNNIDLSYSLAETEGEIIFHLDSTSIVYDDDKLEDSIKYHITTNAGNYYLDNEEAKTVPYFVEAKHTKLSDERGGNEEIPVTFNWENAKGTLDLTKTVSDNTTYAGQIDTTITKANSAGQYLGKTIVLFNEHAREYTPASCFTYEDNENGGITITSYDDSCGAEVIIPEEIDGKPVTELGDSLLFFNRTITNLVLPNNMRVIKEGAIYNTSVEEIELNEGLEKIESNGISMNKITELSIPSTVTTLEDGSIVNNNKLKKIYDNTDKDFDWVSITNSSSASYKTPVDIKETSTTKEVNLLSDWYVTFNGNEATIYKYRNTTNTGSVEIPSTFSGYTVTSIGKEAFKNTKVTNVIIPSTITKIGTRAFVGSNITEVNIPGTVKILDSQAFWNIKSLTKVTLNEGIEYIGYDAFADTSITEITIPSTVTFMGSEAFATNSLKNVTISEGVSEIGSNVFNGTSIEFITMPSTMKTIGHSAFEDSTLINIVLNEGLETIDAEAFYKTLIKNVTIPSTVTTIGDNSLTNNNLKYVVNKTGKVFDWINITTEVGFGDKFVSGTVTDILDSSRIINIVTEINNDESLKGDIEGISYVNSNGDIIIKDYNTASGGTDVIIPEKINGYTVTAIDDVAFYNKGLTSVVIPGSIKTIGNNAFQNNPNLTSVTLNEGLETIGVGAFKGTSITKIDIPGSVKTIKDSAFADNTKLTTLTLNEGLEIIGDSAFNTTGITSVILPSTVKTIGEQSFANNTKLTSVVLNENLETIGSGAFENSNITGAINIPGSIKTISEDAFYKNTNLTSVTFNEGLETIGNTAFTNTGITSVTLPSTVKTVGNSAFEGNTKMTSLTLNEGLETIGNFAFYGTKPTEIIIPSTVTTISTSAFANNNKLTKVVNKTGKAFDWYNLIFRKTGNASFEVGTATSGSQTVNIVSE